MGIYEVISRSPGTQPPLRTALLDLNMFGCGHLQDGLSKSQHLAGVWSPTWEKRWRPHMSDFQKSVLVHFFFFFFTIDFNLFCSSRVCDDCQLGLNFGLGAALLVCSENPDPDQGCLRVVDFHPEHKVRA